MTFEGKAKWFYSHETSNIELIALYVHLKNSNHLRSHSRAIMTLDHSKLGLEKKFLENKSGRIFCFRQVYFTKSCQQIWGCVNQPFILLIQHIWGLFIIQTSDRMKYFTIFHDNLHSVNIQDDQSWAFSEPVKKNSKITYTASRLSLLTSAKFTVNINRVTLQYDKELIMFFSTI